MLGPGPSPRFHEEGQGLLGGKGSGLNRGFVATSSLNPKP